MFRLLFLAVVAVIACPMAPAHAENDVKRARTQMVQQQIVARGLRDARVLEAMTKVPRHAFVPPDLQRLAYADRPLPIGHEQTISQPYIVALMTSLGQPKSGSRVLDVGTGSGYQAAVLAELVGTVYGVEIVCPLAEEARNRLSRLGYSNVTVRCGDGYKGWPEHAPFDLIILAAAPPHVPPALLEQLAPGGRLVLPVGTDRQYLVRYEKRVDGRLIKTVHDEVRFVPMTGEIQAKKGADPINLRARTSEK